MGGKIERLSSVCLAMTLLAICSVAPGQDANGIDAGTGRFRRVHVPPSTARQSPAGRDRIRISAPNQRQRSIAPVPPQDRYAIWPMPFLFHSHPPMSVLMFRHFLSLDPNHTGVFLFESDAWPGELDTQADEPNDPNAPASPPQSWLTDEQIDRAIEWARSMLGRTFDHTQRYNKGGYYYACLGLVYDAYAKTGTQVRGDYGIAHGAAMALDARRNRPFVPPPKGAWVFYEAFPYGHVALSTGDGKVIHVETDPVRRKAQIKIDYYTAPGRYIGWAWPEPERAKNRPNRR